MSLLSLWEAFATETILFRVKRNVVLRGSSCLGRRCGLETPAFILWRRCAVFRRFSVPFRRHADCEVSGPRCSLCRSLIARRPSVPFLTLTQLTQLTQLTLFSVFGRNQQGVFTALPAHLVFTRTSIDTQLTIHHPPPPPPLPNPKTTTKDDSLN
jgi:hypothetical protein